MLQIALHFYEKGTYKTNQTKPGTRRKVKMQGYQISKPNYQILKLALGELVADIPRSRIVHYQYVTLKPSSRWRRQGYFFVIDIDESLLPREVFQLIC